MRIAVLIIGLLLGLVMFLQTFVVYALGSAVEQEDTAVAGAVGLMMSLLWLAACAFVIPFPMVSVICFAVAALAGFAVSGDFPDLAVWGGVSIVLALMSLLGWRGKRQERKTFQIERQRQLDRDDRLETLLRQQRDQVRYPVESAPHPSTQNFCTSCGTRNERGAKFCAECGSAIPVPV